MNWGGMSTTNVFIGNFFFVAGIGMVISAQWELVLGNSYGYTVLSVFGFFYGGFGSIITPASGVRAAYGDNITAYNNALGYFVLSKYQNSLLAFCSLGIVWTVWNLFFLIGSLTLNVVYIGIFFTVQLAFTLVAASYFAAADGHAAGSAALAKAGGVFAILAGLLGYYTVGNLMFQESLNFRFPMGDTSKYFGSKQQAEQ